MPELPEVEIIKRGLEQKIIGLKITEIIILNPKSFIGNPKLLIGSTINGLIRRGKVLSINLDNQYSFLFHLKMSGQIIYEGKKRFAGGHPTKDMDAPLPNKSTRVIFNLSDNSKIYFNDQRKFGWVKVLKTPELKQINYGLKVLFGPEPLDPEFTLAEFETNLLKCKKQPVKVAILDQSVVAGVGNIYASEACFLAGVHPARLVKDLNKSEISKLHQGIVKSLSLGIEHGGASLTHFFDDEGNKGYFLDYAHVFNRQAKPCKICSTPIIKIKLGGRGTYLCLNCQKL